MERISEFDDAASAELLSLFSEFRSGGNSIPVSRLEAFLKKTAENGRHNHSILRLSPLLNGSGGSEHKDVFDFVSVLLQNYIELVKKQEKKSLENTLRASIKKEISEEVKYSFLAHMSHELRTPLNGIVGITELMKKTPLNAQQQKYLTAICDSLDSLLLVINDLLEIRSLETEETRLEETAFDLNDLLLSVINLRRADAAGKAIELAYSISPGCPDTLLGDARKLRQALDYLTGNAVKFTTEGKVEITVDKSHESRNYVSFVFCIKDTGIGIEPENYTKIFNSFTQIDEGYTRKFSGTGLGLSISKKLVELMGGKISVESTVGKGSAFSFMLRFKKAGKQKLLPLPEEKNSAPAQMEMKRKLLIVEDSRINRMVVKDIAMSLNLNVKAVTNGLEALEEISRESYDLILMDIHMPKMDGLEATRRIREFEKKRGRSSSIFVLSAYPLLNDFKEKCYDAGVDGILQKPITAAILKNIVLGKNKLEQEKQAGETGFSLDIDKLLKELGGRKTLLQKLVKYFLANYEQQFDELKKAAGRKDLKLIEMLAHTMKGELDNLRLQKGADLACRIQKAGETGELAGLNIMLDQLKKELDSAARYLRGLTIS